MGFWEIKKLLHSKGNNRRKKRTASGMEEASPSDRLTQTQLSPPREEGWFILESNLSGHSQGRLTQATPDTTFQSGDSFIAFFTRPKQRRSQIKALLKHNGGNTGRSLFQASDAV